MEFYLGGDKRRRVKEIKMSEFLSNKFKWLSLIATCGVVISHSHTGSWTPGVVSFAGRLQAQIVDVMWWPVPLFFVISGYLFCSSYEKYALRSFLLRKFKSLYVPALLWIFLGELLTLPILIHQNQLPSALSILEAFVLGVDRSVSSGGMYGGHLWYVRDLLLYFLIAPVLFSLGKGKCWTVLLSIVLFVVAAFLWPSPRYVLCYELGFFSHDFVFLAIGMALYNTHSGRERMRVQNATAISIVLVILFAMGQIMLGTCSPWWWLANRALPAAALWFFYDVVDGLKGWPRFPKALHGAFVVYCVHPVFIRYISGIPRVCLGTADWVRNMVFVCNVFGGFALSLLLCRLLERYVPKLYQVLSGGRN